MVCQRPLGISISQEIKNIYRNINEVLGIEISSKFSFCFFTKGFFVCIVYKFLLP